MEKQLRAKVGLLQKVVRVWTRSWEYGRKRIIDFVDKKSNEVGLIW